MLKLKIFEICESLEILPYCLDYYSFGVFYQNQNDTR